MIVTSENTRRVLESEFTPDPHQEALRKNDVVPIVLTIRLGMKLEDIEQIARGRKDLRRGLMRRIRNHIVQKMPDELAEMIYARLDAAASALYAAQQGYIEEDEETTDA